jgi:hypothetical protein
MVVLVMIAALRAPKASHARRWAARKKLSKIELNAGELVQLA